MLRKILSFYLVLFTSLYSFCSAAIEIPSCDTSECSDYFMQYKKYARVGYADAMATLGDLYYNGHGTDKNVKKALKRYKMSAKYGSVYGQYKTAMIYLTHETHKDIAQGLNI